MGYCRKIRKFVVVTAAVVAAVAAVTSYGQYNKAYFYWIGRDMMLDSRYREAIRIYNALLRVDPDDYEAYFFRGIAKANLDDNLGAEYDFSLAIEKNPVYTMAYHHRAITRMLLGNYDDALADFREAIELRPDMSGPYYSRGYTYLMNRQFEKAVEDFNTFIFHNNRVADAYILRGMAYLHLNDTVRAMQDYNTAIFTNRESPEGYNRRGATLMEQGRLEEALADFETAVKCDTSYAYSYFNRALANERLGRFGQSLSDLDRVISMNPENPIAYYNRAIVRTNIGDYDNAMSDYDRVAGLSPDNVVVYYNRALLKTRLGDLEGAVKDYTKAIELYPDFAAAYFNRSELRYMLKDSRGARQDRNTGEKKISEYESRLSDSIFVAYADNEQNFTKLLSFETKFTGSNFDRLASARESLTLLPLFRFSLHTPDTVGRIGPAEYYAAGLEDFRRDMEMDDLSFTRLDSDIPVERVMELDRRLAAEISAGNDSWKELFRRGVTQSLVKQFTNSVNSYSLAIDRNPSNPFLYINRSTTRAEMIDFISSMDGGTQRMTIESDPAYRMRGSGGRIYNYDDAIADLNKAAKLMPELAHIYYNRANLLVMSDRLPEAFDEYTRAIGLNPYFAEAYYNRGLVQIYMKDTRKGYLDISKAGELGIPQAYELINRYNPNPEK